MLRDSNGNTITFKSNWHFEIFAFLSKSYSNNYFPAYGIRYFEDPPTFRSDSNTATLIFISDFLTSGRGILMAYVLGKYLYI